MELHVECVDTENVSSKPTISVQTVRVFSDTPLHELQNVDIVSTIKIPLSSLSSCLECDRLYVSSQASTHTEPGGTHEGLLLPKCTICDKMFINSNTFQKHSRCHLLGNIENKENLHEQVFALSSPLVHGLDNQGLILNGSTNLAGPSRVISIQKSISTCSSSKVLQEPVLEHCEPDSLADGDECGMKYNNNSDVDYIEHESLIAEGCYQFGESTVEHNGGNETLTSGSKNDLPSEQSVMKAIQPKIEEDNIKTEGVKESQSELGNVEYGNVLQVRREPKVLRVILPRVILPHRSKDTVNETNSRNIQQRGQTINTSEKKRNNEGLHPKRVRKPPRPMPCPVCKKVCAGQHKLTIHMRKHTGEKPFKCSKCDMTFHSNANLRAHIKFIHVGAPKTFKCTLCPLRFHQASQLRDHVMVHTGEKPFNCQDCLRQFRTGKQLKLHRHNKHSAKEHACQICNKRFGLEKMLKLHMRIHTEVKNSYKCSFCDKVYSSDSGLKQHLISHGVGNTFDCPVCGKWFKSKKNLKEHERVHSGEKPFQCPGCEKTFRTKSQLKDHITIHTGEKLHRCNQCDKSFRLAMTLWVHKKTHSEVNDLCMCEYCGTQCSSSRALIKHRMIHTGEEYKHQCSVCQKRFYVKSHLVEHMRTHDESRPIVKPHSCHVCSTSFYRKSALEDHLRIHTGEKPFECLFCGKFFKSKMTLKTHALCHTEERPHSCGTCKKAFKSIQRLNEHYKNAHTDANKKVCNICGNVLKNMKSLRYHMKSRHRPTEMPTEITINL